MPRLPPKSIRNDTGPSGFSAARTFVVQRHLKSAAEYRKWRKARASSREGAPWYAPANPAVHFGKAWKGWGYFLGTSGLRHGRPRAYDGVFDRVRAIARKAKLQSSTEYLLFRMKSRGQAKVFNLLPAWPPQAFKNEWVSWNDFLGRESTRMLSYEQAKEALTGKELTSPSEYAEWMANLPKPRRLPVLPYQVYRDKWEGWAAFLGVDPRELRRDRRRSPSGKLYGFFRIPLGRAAEAVRPLKPSPKRVNPVAVSKATAKPKTASNRKAQATLSRSKRAELKASTKKKARPDKPERGIPLGLRFRIEPRTGKQPPKRGKAKST